MMITIKVQAVRVLVDGDDQGPHCRAIGLIPSGQVLIYGQIFAGMAPSVQDLAVGEVRDWIGAHRPGWGTTVEYAINAAATCHHSLCGNHYAPGRCQGQCPDGNAAARSER